MPIESKEKTDLKQEIEAQTFRIAEIERDVARLNRDTHTLYHIIVDHRKCLQTLAILLGAVVGFMTIEMIMGLNLF